MEIRNDISLKLMESAKSRRAEKEKFRAQEIEYKNQILADYVCQRPLSTSQLEEIQEIWGTHSEGNAEKWISWYTEKFGTFSPLFVPDSLYYADIERKFNDYGVADVIDHKCYYSLMFPEIKHPECIAYRIRGRWTDSAFSPLSEEDVVDRCVRTGKVIVKPAKGSCAGIGIYIWNDSNNDVFSLRKFLSVAPTDLVIQAFLEQSPRTACFSQSSVNTVRVLTYYAEDDVIALSAVLRMGIDNMQVDNFSAGGLVVGILPNGQLRPWGYTKNGKKLAAHPNGVTFANHQLVNFDEAVAILRMLHKRLPMCRLISWDIAMDKDDSPVFIEMNLRRGELDFHQITNGPLFGTRTKAVLREVYGE